MHIFSLFVDFTSCLYSLVMAILTCSFSSVAKSLQKSQPTNNLTVTKDDRFLCKTENVMTFRSEKGMKEEQCFREMAGFRADSWTQEMEKTNCYFSFLLCLAFPLLRRLRRLKVQNKSCEACSDKELTKIPINDIDIIS